MLNFGTQPTMINRFNLLKIWENTSKKWINLKEVFNSSQNSSIGLALIATQTSKEKTVYLMENIVQ
jgi:hypothetical protein